jgi:hypothetical protein
VEEHLAAVQREGGSIPPRTSFTRIEHDGLSHSIVLRFCFDGIVDFNYKYMLKKPLLSGSDGTFSLIRHGKSICLILTRTVLDYASLDCPQFFKPPSLFATLECFGDMVEFNLQ